MLVRMVHPPKLPVDAEQRRSNINRARAWPLFEPIPGTTGPVAICAAGPSLLGQIPLIKKLADLSVPICAVKGVYSVLAEHGIKVTYAVFLDAKLDQLRFVEKPIDGITYLLASQSPPEMFDALKGQDVRVWHASPPELLQKGDIIVSGGVTTGLRAINLMRWAGYDLLHLFGFDCCLKDGQSHVYAPPNHGKPYKVFVGHKQFVTTPELSIQHEQFIDQVIRATPRPNVFVYGDGTLAEAMRCVRLKRFNQIYMAIDADNFGMNLIMLEPHQVNRFKSHPEEFVA